MSSESSDNESHIASQAGQEASDFPQSATGDGGHRRNERYANGNPNNDEEDDEGNYGDLDEEDRHSRPLRTYTTYPAHADEDPRTYTTYPEHADEDPDSGDFLDGETENKHGKRQYYRDYDDDGDEDVRPSHSIAQLTDLNNQDGYIRRGEFMSANKKIRRDMGAGFEDVLSAVQNVAGIVDRLASTIPLPAQDPQPQLPGRKTKTTSNPIPRPVAKNSQAVRLSFSMLVSMLTFT